jgi:hypothetical protein
MLFEQLQTLSSTRQVCSVAHVPRNVVPTGEHHNIATGIKNVLHQSEHSWRRLVSVVSGLFGG